MQAQIRGHVFGPGRVGCPERGGKKKANKTLVVLIGVLGIDRYRHIRHRESCSLDVGKPVLCRNLQLEALSMQP